MKKRKRLALCLAAGFLLAGILASCGKQEAEKEDTKKKIEEANEKVDKLEEEDEKDREFVFREENGGAVLVEYNGTAEDVVIPDENDGLTVVKIGNGVFRDAEAAMKSLTIPMTVQDIAYDAFKGESPSLEIRGYANTYAELFAAQHGWNFVSQGDNTLEADRIKIYDKEGVHCTEIYRGQMLDEESLAGVEFKNVDGKSVLVLNNCDIGSIETEEWAALTIELAAGSENKVTGGRGRSGIYTSGSLTIRGNGQLSIVGSDYYSLSEGRTMRGVGEGIYTSGTLTIEGNPHIYAKGGKGKSDYYASGVTVWNGDLNMSGGMLEAVAGETEEAYQVPALLVEWSYDENRGGKIQLENLRVTGGGDAVPAISRWTNEDTGATEENGVGMSVSGSDQVVWTEEAGWTGASAHVIIGQ